MEGLHQPGPGIFEGLHYPGQRRAKMKPHMLPPFLKMVEKHEDIPIP